MSEPEHIARLRAFRHWAQSGNGYASVELADALALLADYDALRQRVAGLEANLDARRNIHRYVAFRLADDEEADVQLAADRIMNRLAAVESLLREIRHERRAEPYSMDGTSQWVLLRQSDFTRIDAFVPKQEERRG